MGAARTMLKLRNLPPYKKTLRCCHEALLAPWHKIVWTPAARFIEPALLAAAAAAAVVLAAAAWHSQALCCRPEVCC
jgi:hypothetical protein